MTPHRRAEDPEEQDFRRARSFFGSLAHHWTAVVGAALLSGFCVVVGIRVVPGAVKIGSAGDVQALKDGQDSIQVQFKVGHAELLTLDSIHVQRFQQLERSGAKRDTAIALLMQYTEAQTRKNCTESPLAAASYGFPCRKISLRPLSP